MKGPHTAEQTSRKTDPRGRFAPGTAPGPGRKPDLRRVVRSNVTAARWEQIVATAVSQAIKGDPHARAWLWAILSEEAESRRSAKGLKVKRPEECDPFEDPWGVLGMER